jgi:hypothetical protein
MIFCFQLVLACYILVFVKTTKQTGDNMNIVFQLELRPPLSTVYGPLDYMEFRAQLETIDHLLRDSHIEERFIVNFIKKNGKYSSKVPFLQTSLRTQILLHLTSESYRNLAFRLADSELFRWFIGVNVLEGTKTPSKSTIQRMEHLWNKEEIGALIQDLNKTISDPSHSEKLLHCDTAIEIKDLYADSTCVKANIHHPVDWLLFRDAVITLIGSIKLIRAQGILHRMVEPNSFLKEVNRLTIAMTQSSRNRKGKKESKRIFRKMKQLLKTVERHALRYYEILKENRLVTNWSEKQAHQVLNRMSNVIEQIPAIIKIAHTRIISEKKADNAEKILSLYEKNVHVIKRGKMDADVEFGNGFYLAEQIDGIIVDWDFYKDKPISDSQALRKSVKRVKENYVLKLYSTDRGFNSKQNDRFLDKEQVFNATCPRNPAELTIKMKDQKFRNAQTRRAQTEGRIGIFKNKFIGKKLFRKGFDNREMKILWSILTHNVWVVARKANENYLERIEQSRPQAA